MDTLTALLAVLAVLTVVSWALRPPSRRLHHLAVR
jgi:hypothetical protein